MNDKHRSLLKKIAAVMVVAVIAVLIAFGVYVRDYYYADITVEKYMALRKYPVEEANAGPVKIEQADYGWFLDGPSTEKAMVFYPGAKVDEMAYIPILYQFAESGMDVCLVKMPFHLAVFGMNKASDVMSQYDYADWYIGGHSLGGAMGASYASGHADELCGVVLLAAYATKDLDDSLTEIVVYGSEDNVLRRNALEEGRAYAPERYYEYEIEGGNHAQFGNYGEQKGDGQALITASEQQAETVRLVMEVVGAE